MGNADTLIFYFINRDLRNGLFDAFMPFITSNAWMFFLPLFLWLFVRGKRHAFIALIIALASLGLADWGANSLKHLFERPRPCNILDGINLLAGCSRSFSMPSNHASNAFAVAMPFLILFRTRLRYLFLAVAATVAFSRVYVGVHYPSDVIVGAITGSMAAMFVIALYKWASVQIQDKPLTTILTVFLLSLSLFRIYYILNGPLDLGPDEAHYWEWSRRPDLSYYSKGPMIAYLIYAGTSLFGDNVFGIRIMAVIFSAMSSVFIYLLGKEMFNGKTGLYSALLLQIIPLFSTYGIIFTIDSPFIFFWILSLYLFWKAVHKTHDYASDRVPPSPVYWLALGFSVGLGLLTKYTMAFFFLCAFLFLLFSKEYRKVLTSPYPYLAFLFSIFIFSPVIIWNAQHDWVTLRHTAGQAHLGTQSFIISSLWAKDFFSFIGSQTGIITPVLFVMIFCALIKLQTSQRAPGSSYLFWFSIPVIGFFTLKSLHGKVQANWAMTGYLTGIIAFSAWYLQEIAAGRTLKKIMVISAILLSATVTAASHYPSILSLPVKLDPSARLQGWKSLGHEVTTLYEQLSVARPVFIISDQYQISSELAFHVRGHPVTYCINLGRRMNQYDIWPGFHNLLHHDALYIAAGDVPVTEKLSNAFESVEKRIFTAYNKQHMKLRDYSIVVCRDFKGMPKETTGKY